MRFLFRSYTRFSFLRVVVLFQGSRSRRKLCEHLRGAVAYVCTKLEGQKKSYSEIGASYAMPKPMIQLRKRQMPTLLCLQVRTGSHNCQCCTALQLSLRNNAKKNVSAFSGHQQSHAQIHAKRRRGRHCEVRSQDFCRVEQIGTNLSDRSHRDRLLEAAKFRMSFKCVFIT